MLLLIIVPHFRHSLQISLVNNIVPFAAKRREVVLIHFIADHSIVIVLIAIPEILIIVTVRIHIRRSHSNFK